MRVIGGNSRDSLEVASSECQSNGNSNKCRSSCLLAQGASVLNFLSGGNSNKRRRDIVKKIKDDMSADSLHAPPWEGLRAALLVRRDRHAAGALQRGLADHAGVRGSGARSDRLRAVAARLWRALWQRSRHATSCGVVFLLSHDLSQVQRKGDLVERTKHWMLQELEWEDSQKGRSEEHATNHDIKLRRDDDGGRKRGALYGSHNTVLLCRVEVFFFLRDFLRSAVQWVSSRSEGGRPRCFSTARSMECVLLSFP